MLIQPGPKFRESGPTAHSQLGCSGLLFTVKAHMNSQPVMWGTVLTQTLNALVTRFLTFRGTSDDL